MAVTLSRMPQPSATIELTKRGLSADEFASRWASVHRHIRSLLWGILRDNDDADDAEMETAIALFQAKDRYDTTKSFERWATVAATRKALNIIRVRDRRRIESFTRRSADFEMEIPYEDPGFSETDERLANRVDLAEIIALAMETNTLGIAMAVRCCAGESHEDLARSAGIPIGTVKSQIHRGFKTMRLAAQEIDRCKALTLQS